MRKALLLLTLTYSLIGMPQLAFSQNDEKSNIIGIAGSREFGMNICADATGNKYIAGQSGQKGLVVKQNAVNAVLWSKTLTYTTNPGDFVKIGFLDLAGDTVFGCGKVTESLTSIGKGSFYFKMNAQTGALYWSKFEAGANYLSCMRYSNGKFFLIGGNETIGFNNGARVLAVSSQTGQIIWQNSGIYGAATTTGVNQQTFFVSATEMVNGKMYLTGFSVNHNLSLHRPILVGVTETGILFLQKYLNIPGATSGVDEYIGHRIEYDQDQNLVILISDNIPNPTLDPVFVKCDPLGNLLFAKRYGPVNTKKFLLGINETPTHYVLYGLDITSGTKPFALKVFKNGVVDKGVSIYKPNVFYSILIGLDHLMGNSAFINGLHYFIASETASGTTDRDINQLIMDEDLNLVGDCSQTPELPWVASDIPVTIQQLVISNIPSPLTFSNGVVIEDQPLTDPCVGVSLDLVQNTDCQVLLTATVAGFTNPTFYWSNGSSDTSNTSAVSTTDTVIVRVLDTKCCELIDTIVPVLAASSFVMNLPADTVLCLQSGNSLTIVPSFSGANGAVTYLWSNNSTAPSLSVTQSGTYWVDVSDNCFTRRDSITVSVNLFPVITNAGNTAVCEGNFPATLNPTVSGATSVLWENGSTQIPRSVSGTGTYTLTATNSCGSVNAIIVVTQTDLPSIQLIASVDTCIQNGSSFTLIPTAINASTISWSDGSIGSQLAVSNSGIYTVYGSNVCGVDSASCSVTINYFPELDLPFFLDTCFEIGVGFSYTAQGSPGSYQWSSGSQTAVEWISQEGIYSCTLTNSCGSITDSMQVRRLTEVDLYFPKDSLEVCTKLLAVSSLQIETNYNLEVVAPNGNLTGLELSESGWYAIHAFNACGEKWDSIYVNLQDEQFFYLPNSFTPNGDEHNARFEFKGDNITIRDIRIFNRWGEEVFTESGNFTGWDGTYRGEICPDGIYAVSLIYEDCFGMPTEFKGHINLIR